MSRKTHLAQVIKTDVQSIEFTNTLMFWFPEDIGLLSS